MEGGTITVRDYYGRELATIPLYDPDERISDMAEFITVTDQGGKKINVNVDQITHFYDHYIWVAGSVTVEVKELGGQIAMLIGKAKSPTRGTSVSEPKGPFDNIVKDHLEIGEGH